MGTKTLRKQERMGTIVQWRLVLEKKDENFICCNRREEFRNSGKAGLQI